jgi:predicted DsbA family dithiol-disulfide isomerase
LFWAANELDLKKQAALKTELLNTYFCLGVSLDDDQNLIDAVVRAGLDETRARAILSSGEFAEDVKQELQHYKSMGINSVPSLIVNDQYLLQGAQPSDMLINAFTKLASN